MWTILLGSCNFPKRENSSQCPGGESKSLCEQGRRRVLRGAGEGG